MSGERIAYERLLWISGCLVLALLPHIRSIPIWVLGICVAAGAIRLALGARGLDAPPRVVRMLIACLAIGLLFLRFHTFNGISAGTSLLALMAGLKLLETRTTRDVCVLILIVYFLSLAALLAGESFWLLGYLVGVCWLTTATLLRLTVSQPGPSWRACLRYSGRILLHAMPLALVLWLFFPRFAEPFWRVGDPAASANSGLGDSMSPGDITDLALSDDVAFRVRFDDAYPRPQERYWRGPVLYNFDGRTWRRTDANFAAAPAFIAEGPAYRYTVSLEPYPHSWIFTLDWPTEADLPNARMTGDLVLMQSGPVSRPTDVAATSHTLGRFEQNLSPALRLRDLRLPTHSNPRTVEFALQLHREHPQDDDFVRSVLDMLHTQEYYYTLEPPPLGANSVDEFLFETKRGFCGHYASAFAVLMRAAGIPARVVTGYVGGAYNQYAHDWIVRQSDAHAWDEVWIAPRGWTRVDPTAAIDPMRIDRRLRDAQSAIAAANIDLGGNLPWLTDVRMRLDAMRQLWRESILRYNPASQQSLLAHLMIPEPDARKLVWVLAAGLSLALGWLTWQVRRELRPRLNDALTRAYARLCAKLAARGLPRAAHEGAESFAARIAAVRPDLAVAIVPLCRRYSELRYGRSRTRAEVGQFALAVRAFRPRDSRAS
jgi:transglutaminase-like putative cysteine protease